MSLTELVMVTQVMMFQCKNPLFHFVLEGLASSMTVAMLVRTPGKTENTPRPLAEA
jgi:hypothetical protein